MTKRSADLASTSTDEAKRPKTRLVLPDGCMVNIQAKTPNDGHQTAHENPMDRNVRALKFIGQHLVINDDSSSIRQLGDQTLVDARRILCRSIGRLCSYNIVPLGRRTDFYPTIPILAQRIADRVGEKWAEIVWNLRKEEPTTTQTNNASKTRNTRQSTVKSTDQPQPVGRQNDLHSMSTEQLQEIHTNLTEEMRRLVAENQRIRIYAKEKFNLDEL